MSDKGPQVTGFFDPATSSLTYLVADLASKTAAIVDPVLDFDPKSGRTSTANADRLLAAAEGLRIAWILETHTHADHLSAAPYVKAKTGGRVGIGAAVVEVQKTWQQIFNLQPEFRADGSQFDHLFADGERFAIGGLSATVWHTPGHTPACLTYVVDGQDSPTCAFVGDTLFMPDYGTARADFPGGDARRLYRSIQRILALAAETRLFVCHDYQPGGRALAFETTVAEQRRTNVHVKEGTSEDQFVTFRSGRDKTLGQPTLLLPSIQVNIRGGNLPAAEDNGTIYLKLPLNKI
jgi:glyoxylase-like metal-dependent hydrolase (beta-lactamase superfamily II)